jgi:hypothetical protein
LHRNALANLLALQNLNLSNNSLTMFDIVLGPDMLFLNLSFNHIETLQPLKQSPLSIDIGSNNLTCGCSDIAFIVWFKSSDVDFIDADQVFCLNPILVTVAVTGVDIKNLTSFCFPSNLDQLLQASLVPFCALAIVCSALYIYYNRWRLSFWWFATKKSWRTQKGTEETDNFDFDAFVAHDYSDFEWIRDELLVEMEVKRHFRLCISERDFTAGKLHVAGWEGAKNYVSNYKMRIISVLAVFN